MAGERKRRMGENEAVFRAANERMASWEERDRLEAVELYFCECADPACMQKVRLRGSDYERVRSDQTHFFVAPEHEVADVETVLESHPDWVLVEKDEAEARDVAEETDPRQD
jgi:hypothetical protein